MPRSSAGWKSPPESTSSSSQAGASHAHPQGHGVDTVLDLSGRGPRDTVTVTTFRHEAMLYGDDRRFIGGARFTSGRSRQADAGGAGGRRSPLGTSRCRRPHPFADMAGRSPADHPGVKRLRRRGASGRMPFRGIGEPIWPNRTADEPSSASATRRCSTAFADTPSFRLLCLRRRPPPRRARRGAPQPPVHRRGSSEHGAAAGQGSSTWWRRSAPLETGSMLLAAIKAGTCRHRRSSRGTPPSAACPPRGSTTSSSQ